jgi:hypothetical protein
MHMAIRDLKREKKELKELRAQWLNSDELIAKINDTTSPAIEKFLAVLTDQVEQATEAVYRRFDTIMMICMGEDPESVKEGKITTLELMREFVKTRNLPISIMEVPHLELHPDDYKTERKLAEKFGVMLVPNSRLTLGKPILVFPALGDTPSSALEVILSDPASLIRASQLVTAYTNACRKQLPKAFRRAEEA